MRRTKLSFKQTLVHGRYQRDLAKEARRVAELAKTPEELLIEEAFDDKLKSPTIWDKIRNRPGISHICDLLSRAIVFLIHIIGAEWIFLTLLGFSVAFLSVLGDYCVRVCVSARVVAFLYLDGIPWLQYIVWVGHPTVFILFSIGFVQVVSPLAAGSGLPEVKVIMSGFKIDGFLKFRTLVAKIVGLTACLSSGLPIGKEGPLVHIGGCLVHMFRKLPFFKEIFKDETRRTEMLAAAAVVGVSCTFGAPIGGLLFSIEVTTSYFSVRSYTRGFYAALCASLLYRLLPMLISEDSLMIALFRTNFYIDMPFNVAEFLIFVIIGVFCGLAGALFIWLNRNLVLLLRRNQRLSKFLQQNRFIFPIFICIFTSTLTFPLGLGKFIGNTLTLKQQIDAFLINVTWLDIQKSDIYGNYSKFDTLPTRDKFLLEGWLRSDSNVLINLVAYIVIQFCLTLLVATLAIPGGIAITMFAVGAAFGRLIGEMLEAFVPESIRLSPIIPGGYAMVGAAAMTGSLTHALSISVVMAESTGHLNHMLPIMVAVFVSLMVAGKLQPSLYDSIIRMKKLPYIPSIARCDWVFRVSVEDVMISDVQYVSQVSTYQTIQNLLTGSDHVTYPIVDDPERMILIGTVARFELERILRRQVQRWKHQAIDEEDEVAPVEPKGFEIRRVSRRKKSNKSSSQYDVPAFELTVRGKGKKSNDESCSTMPHPNSAMDHPKIRTFSLTEMNGAATNTVTSTLSDTATATTSMTPNASLRGRKHVGLPKLRLMDLDEEERQKWMKERLRRVANLKGLRIDPAPLQLVERTPLLKVHSIFSLMGVRTAYVTRQGQLVGVISLPELKKGIEKGPEIVPQADSDDEESSDDDDDAAFEESQEEYFSYSPSNKRRNLKSTAL